MEQWREQCPVVIVPTKYYTTPTEEYEKAGVSVVIWANHLMRSSITAMQRVAAQILRDRSLLAVEPVVAPLAEVFRLQDENELCAAESKYLPKAPDADEPAAAQEVPLRTGTTGASVPLY
jgi:phosphoenolpyruvate phosphomutase